MSDVTVRKAKWWQLPLVGCMGISINLYVFFMSFISYYLNGFLGVTVVLATSFVTAMRLWDGVTDPVAGHWLDKLQTRFGKYRPFILIGNIGCAVTTYILLHVSHLLPKGLSFVFFVVVYMIQVVFLTLENTAAYATGAILTNDPRQRAYSGTIGGIFIMLLYSVLPAYMYGTLVGQTRGFTLEFFDRAFWLVAPLSLLCAILAAIGIAPVDKKEFFPQSAAPKFSLKKYWEVLRGNKAMRMLVISASTDKLATTIQNNATVTVIIYGIICGNIAVGGGMAAYTAIPNILFTLVGVGLIASRLGQKRAMVISSVGGLITCVLMILLFYVLEPSTFALPGYEGFAGWTTFSLLYLGLYLVMKGFASISNGVISPMIADVTDYEIVRTGEFIPGLISSVFSFVDKVISSFAATIVGLLCAMIGFGETLPQADTPFSQSLKVVGLFCMFGTIIIGYLCNLYAMHQYPLSKKEMIQIEAEVAKIKAGKGQL